MGGTVKPDLTGLSPKDLFYTQREAYLKGDFASVKEMAEIARSRMKLAKQENWVEAKKKLDGLDFPTKNDRNWIEVKQGEYHSQKKNSHKLQTFKQWGNILGFEYEAKMNRCNACNKMMNAALILYNNETAQIYEKWFMFNGKEVEGKNIIDVAEEIFAD